MSLGRVRRHQTRPIVRLPLVIPRSRVRSTRPTPRGDRRIPSRSGDRISQARRVAALSGFVARDARRARRAALSLERRSRTPRSSRPTAGEVPSSRASAVVR